MDGLIVVQLVTKFYIIDNKLAYFLQSKANNTKCNSKFIFVPSSRVSNSNKSQP